MERIDMYVGQVVSSFTSIPEYIDEGRIEHVGMDYVVVRIVAGGNAYQPILVRERDYENLLEGTIEENRQYG